MAHPQIAAFARLANGGDTPLRAIAGQATKLSRTMHDVRYDEARDEVFVGNPFAQAIMVFRGSANGNEAPIRYIQGPHTELITPDNLEIDTVHHEILVPDTDGILVFPEDANGDVAPIRKLHGRNWSASALAVDPIHNVLVVSGTHGSGSENPYTSARSRDRKTGLMIFNRTDSGEAEPKAMIAGPKTGIIGLRQIQVYPKNGWIVVSQITDGVIEEPEGTFVGVWSINDNGDVPPRWKIDGGKQLTVMKKPRGVVLDPKHKELIVADMRLNAVLTYSFPEIF